MFRKNNVSEDVSDIDENEDTEEIESGMRFIIFPLSLEVILLGILFLKSQAAATNYLYALVPLLAVTAAVGTYVYNRDGDMKLFNAAASLTAIGTALQILVDEVYSPISSFSLVKMLLSLAVAVVFVMMYRLFRKLLNTPFTVYAMIAVCAAIYLVLHFKGVDPNGYGTSAWIRIGSYTLQLTDFTKIAAVIFYGALFSTHVGRNDKNILIVSTIFFGVNMLGSVMIHELGSFLILFFLHLSILFIFMNRGKTKRIYLLTIFFLVIGAVIMCFILYSAMLPAHEAGTLSGIAGMIWSIVNKVHTRFSVTANIYADPNGSGYQLMQGLKALWMAGLFGNTVNFNAIPVAESDMAFISLVSCFGWLMGFLTLFLFWKIFRHGTELSRKLLSFDVMDSIVVYGITVLLCMQAAIVILGSCNVIPFAGLPIPFLSRGGTYQMLVFCFIGQLLHASEHDGTRMIEISDESSSDEDTEKGDVETDDRSQQTQ